MKGLTVRYITGAEYAAAMGVWAVCFPEDEESFIDYYFERRTKPEYILGAFTDGRLIGTLHMIPERIMLFESVKEIGFVAGVATLPEFRRQGVAAAMLERSFIEMTERGCCATVLQPFDVGFYQAFGYEPFVYRREYALQRADAEPAVSHGPDAAELFRIYTRFASGYEGMAVRSMEDCATLLREREGGARFIAANGAYAMYYPGDTAEVMELAGDTAEFMPLIKAILIENGGGLIARTPKDIRLSGAEGVIKPFNMIKPLDFEALMAGLPVSYDGLLSDAGGVAYSFESY